MNAIPILAWARTPVAPVGGVLAACQPHDLAAPLVARMLADAGLPPEAVDAVVLGNALGAGGNPARMLALAAGLPEGIPAVTLDSQCCAGLDAVTHACGLLALGQADVVIAGGAEAWSRAPLRMHRPLQAEEAPVPYDRPPFTPWPARDPDMLLAALDGARRLGLTRHAQDAYAMASHARSVAARAAMAHEIVPLRAFDTSWRIYRKVHKDCTVRFEGNSYVVPHTLVGRDLVLRVKERSMRIFADDRLIVTYDVPEGKGHLVQDKRFYEALKKDREMNRRKYGRGRRGKGRAKCTISPLKPLYDMDVEIRSPRVYDSLIGEVRI